jgi:L-threonylcarbamoyladenylate synthase
MGTDLLILDGGPCSLGIESTIVDCSRGVPVLLRPGSMTAAQIEAACGQALRAAKDMPTYTAAPRASGTLESHYAPRAKVCLLSKDALKTALQNWSDSKTKPVKVPIGVYVRSFTPKDESALAVRQMPMDAERAAYELFAVLRDLDAHNVAEIWVESVPNEPLWAGVADRLQRASS